VDPGNNNIIYAGAVNGGINLAGQVGQSNYYAYNLSVGLRIPF